MSIYMPRDGRDVAGWVLTDRPNGSTPQMESDGVWYDLLDTPVTDEHDSLVASVTLTGGEELWFRDVHGPNCATPASGSVLIPRSGAIVRINNGGVIRSNARIYLTR